MAARTPSSATPEDILAPFAADVRALAGVLRALVRETVPGVTERAYPGWRGIGYRDAQSGYFCGIFPQRETVRLLFEHGAALADPEGLLTDGRTQVRWMELHPGRRVPRDGIARLIHAALLHGAIR
jgi:hypothetical protein